MLVPIHTEERLMITMRRILPGLGVTVPSDVKGKKLERMYPIRINIPAAKAVAASDTGVLSASSLLVATQEIIANITDPAFPRSIRIKGNLSGIAGNVVIHGTNDAGKVISETIALNGATAAEGNKAFDSVSKVDLPVRTHVPVAQVETATVAGTIGASGAGNVEVIVTAAGMTGSPKTILVAVANDDSANTVAGKIRTALGLDVDVIAKFAVSGATNKVILTALTTATNDATLNIATDNDTSTGLTPAASSVETTAGVAPDTVSIGWGNKIGIPYKLPFNTVSDAFLGGTKEGTAPTVVTSTTDLESNTLLLNTALNGTDVDVLLLV